MVFYNSLEKGDATNMPNTVNLKSFVPFRKLFLLLSLTAAANNG